FVEINRHASSGGEVIEASAWVASARSVLHQSREVAVESRCQIPGAGANTRHIGSIGVSIGSDALGVMRDDLHPTGKVEVHVLDVLRRSTTRANKANEEVTALALRTGDHQQANVHGITTDIACACELTGDAGRHAACRTEWHESAVIVVDQHVHVAGSTF